MALQDANVLSMVGLGTLHDSPVNSLQPKLVDAVHLRWAFRPESGFPWHGFYLFRRNSRRSNRQCLSSQTGNLQPGPMIVSSWASGIGTVSSDEPLVLRDDVPPANQVEFDLDGREYFEFLPLQLARAVDIQVSFRKDEAQRPRCLHFREMRPEALPNPYARLDVFLETFDREKKPNPINQIVQIEVGGVPTTAFLLGATTTIKTVDSIHAVKVQLVGFGKIQIRATDGAGVEVLGTRISNPKAPIQVYRIEGEQLHDSLITLEGETYLLSLCIEGKELSRLVEIPATAYLHGSEVARIVLSGLEGNVVSGLLEADAIDRIRISGGFASLVELCWSSVFQDAQAGWKPVEGVKQPITLPVLHPDYPASGNLPTNLVVSRTEALARIKYGNPNIWQTPFTDLHDQCELLVRGGPAIPMSDPSRSFTFPVESDPGDTSTPPTVPQQHPLQLLLLGAMHAPIAQLLGLYWSDTTALPGETYDYLIVADHQGTGNGQVQKVLSLIISEGFVNLDGYIVFGKRIMPQAPIEPPTDARGYVLPGATRPDPSGGLVDASCNAGLRWQLPVVNNVLLPESPVLYHLWRVGYGPSEPASPAATTKFDPLTKETPLLVVENQFSTSGVQRPPDWPPFSLYGFDNAVAEGWYGYRVSSVDLFGRHSSPGADVRWFEWAPVPTPKPWYYLEPAGDRTVHPFALGLLDKVPPPPPAGTEAFALDADDPFVQRDATYNAWFATLSTSERTSVVGLRVRWNWTEAHMRQAPDTKEFRIYYQDGRLNTHLGQTTAVTASSATESFVQTDIPNAHPAETFVECSLKIGPDMFKVVGSDAGSPLRLRVKNIGPLKNVSPSLRVNCEVNIPNTHVLFVNYGIAHPWDERHYVVNFNEHVTVGVDEAGRPLRRYEVILPADGDIFRGGLPLHPDLAEPVKFAAIGVTAADSRTHAADDSKWTTGRWGDRTGNESSMSPPAIVFRVLREKPTPPVPPPDAEKVFATAADYHAASFYTFRWAPQPHLKTHVYRAMDDTIFNLDLSYQPRVAITAGDLSIFPSAAIEPRWNGLKRQQVANELNVLNTFPKTPTGREQARKHYRGLSNDALRVLANLPNNETAFAQITVIPLDPNNPTNANRVGPDNPHDFVVDPALRIYIDTLDGRSTNRFFYKACYVDGAQNRSRLSQSGPPIWLPNVVPPRSPTFTKVLAGDANPADPGDSKITLRWTSNREADLAEYRIYRALSEADARSIRSMTLVHTLAAPAGEPATRPAENVWTDAGIPALRWIYYRLTAVDTAGNESAPNDVVKARAFDESLPEIPALAVAWAPVATNVARAQWTAGTDTRLERRGPTELIWENASDWLSPGTHSFDDSLDEHFPWKFRLRARKSTGAIAVGADVNLLSK